MKIKSIELSNEEFVEVYETLINKFDLSYENIWMKGQSVEFELNDLIFVESKLSLDQDSYMELDTNAHIINSQSVCTFEINFYYDGEEVNSNYCNSDLDDKIRDYYRI